ALALPLLLLLAVDDADGGLDVALRLGVLAVLKLALPLRLSALLLLLLADRNLDDVPERRVQQDLLTLMVQQLILVVMKDRLALLHVAEAEAAIGDHHRHAVRAAAAEEREERLGRLADTSDRRRLPGVRREAVRM